MEQDIQWCFQYEAELMVAEGYYLSEGAYDRRNRVICILGHYSKSAADRPMRFLALSYFDRYISRRSFTSLQERSTQYLKFFVVCCLSIAWKITRHNFQTPEFLKTEESESHRIRCLELDHIGKVEFDIISALSWRILAVTPSSFLDYFISLVGMDDQYRQDLKLCAERSSISRMILDIRCTQYRPSTIAATGILLQTVRHDPQSSTFQSVITACPYVDQEELQRCRADVITRLIVDVVDEINRSRGPPKLQL